MAHLLVLLPRLVHLQVIVDSADSLVRRIIKTSSRAISLLLNNNRDGADLVGTELVELVGIEVVVMGTELAVLRVISLLHLLPVRVAWLL